MQHGVEYVYYKMTVWPDLTIKQRTTLITSINNPIKAPLKEALNHNKGHLGIFPIVTCLSFAVDLALGKKLHDIFSVSEFI